jgi:hypothetical protein
LELIFSFECNPHEDKIFEILEKIKCLIWKNYLSKNVWDIKSMFINVNIFNILKIVSFTLSYIPKLYEYLNIYFPEDLHDLIIGYCYDIYDTEMSQEFRDYIYNGDFISVPVYNYIKI